MQKSDGILGLLLPANQDTPEAVQPTVGAPHAEQLLLAAGPLEKLGVCCINMDYGTPDENVMAMLEVVESFR